MAYICEQCKTELKSKPKTYYKKELHFIKDLGYVKVSLNPKDADGIIRIMCYECQKKILEEGIESSCKAF